MLNKIESNAYKDPPIYFFKFKSSNRDWVISTDIYFGT